MPLGRRFLSLSKPIPFLISYNGKTIFHTGDADPDLTDQYTGIKPAEQDIDIAFINDQFGNPKNFQVTNSFIAADKNIAMHFPKEFFKMEKIKLGTTPDSYTEPVVFKEAMEGRVFYLSE